MSSAIVISAKHNIDYHKIPAADLVLTIMFNIALCSFFNGRDHIWSVFVMSAACACITAYLVKLKKIIFVLIPFLITLAVDLGLYGIFSKGLSNVINQILTAYGKSNGRIVRLLDVEAGGEYFFLWTFVCFVFTVNALFIKCRSGSLKYLYAAVIAAGEFIIGSQELYQIFIFFSLFLLNILYSAGLLNLRNFIIYTVVLAISMTVIIFTPIWENSQLWRFSQKARGAAESFADSVRFGAGEPEIEVVMENPQPCYLKSFTGGKFLNGVWTQIDNTELYDWSDEFYWLNKSGFSVQMSMKNLPSLSDKRDEGLITVNVKSGSRKKLFIPYGAASADKISEDINAVGGEILKSDGQKFYRFKVNGDYLFKTNEIYNNLISGEQRDDVKEYLKKQKVYSDFASSCYTSLNFQEKNIIKNYLGEADENLSVYEIRVKILEFMEHLDYCEDGGDLSPNLAASVIEENRGGNQSEYAALTVELLRYYGVPARYCEGYAVTKEDCSELAENSALHLNYNNYHAWAEYYMDGIGWLPFETCPKYIGMIQENDILGKSSGDFEGGTKDNNASAAEKIVPFEENADNKSRSENKIKEIAAAIAVLMLLLITVIVFKLIRYAFVERRLKRLDNKSACIQIFIRTKKILLLIIKNSNLAPEEMSEKVNKCFGRQFAEKYNECFKIFEKAKFSNLQTSDDERVNMLELFKFSKEAVNAELNPIQKIYLRVVRNIY